MKSTLLYGSDKGSDSKGASEFVTRLLNGVTMAHMHHLMTVSYAKHKALGDLYEELAEAADTLAEAFMGCSGQDLSFTGGSVTVGSDAMADVQSLYEYVEQNKLAMGTESHIQNEVDNVCTIISTCLYKLRKLA